MNYRVMIGKMGLVYCINDIYNNPLFCQRLLIGRKNDRI